MRFSPRRRLCRTLFCIGCLLPTLLVGGAALVVQTPAYHTARMTAWQSRLAARLGLEVHVDAIEWDAADSFVLRGVELRDPESHLWLARARSASVMPSDNGSVVTLGQPEIDFRRLPRLVEVLHEHLLLRSDATDETVQLLASTLTLQQDQSAQSVLDARFAVEVSGEGSEAFVEFRPTGSEEGDQVRLRVVRNRQLDPPATGWELHTGPMGLPCHLATAWLPQLEQLGSECTFQGSVWSEQIESLWEAEISGVFCQLDLDRLITSRFQHKLSGMSQLTLRRLIVHRSRITEAAGQLHSAGGAVSQSLLDAAQRSLALTQHPRSGGATKLPYSELSLQFALDANGLAIAPQREPEQDAETVPVLSDSHGALLSVSEAVQVSPLALVQMLAPMTELQVPASRETVALLQVLPLPEITPSTRESARPELSTLRFQQR